MISQPSTGAGSAPRLFEVRADAFIGNSALHEEVFGPAAVVVRVQSIAQVAVVQGT
ncbi:hypothetical protein [Burkholderia sp. Bp9015]|uniref:hypothetical protein n=1 Tax=Burkholderia sp. Bp9015 TaxID=2184563 RepID=UPI00162A52E8|nr:hypothetical protein [Burkholderia sp. Bp9015]